MEHIPSLPLMFPLPSSVRRNSPVIAEWGALPGCNMDHKTAWILQLYGVVGNDAGVVCTSQQKRPPIKYRAPFESNLAFP